MKSSALAKTPMIGPKLATRAEALEMDREAIAIVGEMESSWLRLGKIVKRVIDSKAYKALGFETEGAWLAARVRGSVSKVFAAVQCVRALEGVPEEKLLEIGTVNANMLAKLPEKIRKLPEWVDKAASETTDDFRRIVNVKLGIEQEDYRTWSLLVPKDVLQELRDAESKVAGLLGIEARSTVWSRIATLINTTEKEHLVIEMRGEE